MVAERVFLSLESVRYTSDDVGSRVTLGMQWDWGGQPAFATTLKARHGESVTLHRPLGAWDFGAGDDRRFLSGRVWAAAGRSVSLTEPWAPMDVRFQPLWRPRSVGRVDQTVLVRGTGGDEGLLGALTLTFRAERAPAGCRLRVFTLARYPSTLDPAGAPLPYAVVASQSNENLLIPAPFAPPAGTLVEIYAHVPDCPDAKIGIRRGGAKDVSATLHKLKVESGDHRIYALAPDSGRDIRFTVTAECGGDCGGEDKQEVAFVGG